MRRPSPRPPADRGLPGSELLYDVDALAEVLGAPGATLRLRYAEHEPGVSIVVVVEVDGRLAAVSIGRLAPIADGPQVARFPDDVGLPACRAGWDEVERRLGPVRDAERLAWVPHRRLVLGTGASVVKLHAASAETVDAVELTGLAAEVVAAPEVLAVEPDLAVHVQARVPGRTLERADAVGRAADAVAVLDDLAHLDPARLRPHPPAELLAQCRPVVRLVEFSVPGLADRAERLLVTLAERCPDAARPVAAHGDFNVGQLLDDGRRLVVVDTDTLCAAPAEYDPASYCANVVSGRPDDLDDARELARVVCGAAGGRLDADVFDWYLAAMVVRRLDRAIRRTKRDWPERTERLVEAAEELLR